MTQAFAASLVVVNYYPSSADEFGRSPFSR